VGRTVEAMTAINASNMKLADIISVIDSIAFQTTLALNAAVEAARTGAEARGGCRGGGSASARLTECRGLQGH